MRSVAFIRFWWKLAVEDAQTGKQGRRTGCRARGRGWVCSAAVTGAPPLGAAGAGCLESCQRRAVSAARPAVGVLA